MYPGKPDADPYLELYRFDLFISYAHGPVNKKGQGPLRKWSAQFHDLLEQNIRIFAGDPIRISFDGDYMDDGIDPLTAIDEQLEERVKSSALFQVHMVDWYLKSEWCARELEYWLRSAPMKPGCPKDRISVVRMAHTLEDDWPDALKPNGFPLPGERFHDINKLEPWGLNRAWDEALPSDEFAKRLTRLAHSLGERIKDLRDEIRRNDKERRHVLALRGRSEPPLLLVHAPTIDDETRSGMTEALAARNIRVEFGLPPIADLAETEKAISRSSAMLIVATEASELPASMHNFGFEWRRSARARFRKPLPCAILDREGVASKALKSRAQWLGIDWINKRKDWVSSVSEWLSGDAAAWVAQNYDIEGDALDG